MRMNEPHSRPDGRRLVGYAGAICVLLTGAASPAVADTLIHSMSNVWVPATALGLSLITAAGGSQK
jgi:hypothetical protein